MQLQTFDFEIDDDAGKRLIAGGSAIILAAVPSIKFARWVFPRQIPGLYYIMLALFAIGFLWIILGAYLDPDIDSRI